MTTATRNSQPATLTYHTTPAQKAAAEQAAQDFILLRADHPTAVAPKSFLQMILNEAHGWLWNFDTDHYERENK